ncbi:hypothetical protein [Streptomyces sp. URMC 129]|uniref:hypothetical protein n=1 Tax=Streptomyces sp. URMC 129 TaxID=3423407 RepID=UPI003F1AD6E8
MVTLMSRTPRPARPCRPHLERQAIRFTVGLYLFICAALLLVHYTAPEPPPVPGDAGSSSTSPFTPVRTP